MTRHLGVSVFLSVSIVIFFAVALYQTDGPSEAGGVPPLADHANGTTGQQPAPSASNIGEQPPLPPVARTLPASRRTASLEPKVARLESRRGDTPTPPSARRPARRAEQLNPREPASAAGAPRGFIQADAGETIADVAVRVYGSADAAGPLWLANRDILPDRDQRLAARTVLRSP